MKIRNANAIRRLRQEVDSWAAETRLLLEACRILVEYHGTKSELKSWDAATKEPLRWVSLVVEHFASNIRGVKPISFVRAGYAFRCSESTARIVSPFAEIVGGPVANFVFTVRKVFQREQQSRHIFPYGNFSVSFADAVTYPLWKQYRQLAPEEWKRVYPKAVG